MTLALAEHEVGRETVLKIPVAERKRADFRTETVDQEGSS